MVNANARRVIFKEAAEARNHLPNKAPVAPGMGRRVHGIHGTMEQTYWIRGRPFLIDKDVEIYPIDYESPYCECEMCCFEFEPPYMYGNDGEAHIGPSSPVLDSLLDIAQPAKPKGVAKDFEVVDSVTRVIAFEDDGCKDDSSLSWGDDDDFWDEWIDAYRERDEVRKEKKPSYSAIVKNGSN
ncbi:hypothetical protein DXG01_016082 [Tephrocybe rancida]|nr:hypothetical protein DXG01_016082 [Tephrocybe rancida]